MKYTGAGAVGGKPQVGMCGMRKAGKTSISTTSMRWLNFSRASRFSPKPTPLIVNVKQHGSS